MNINYFLNKNICFDKIKERKLLIKKYNLLNIFCVVFWLFYRDDIQIHLMISSNIKKYKYCKQAFLVLIHTINE